MSTKIKTIRGKEKESRIIQDPMFIHIMKDFGEEKNIPMGQEAKYLRQMVKNVHITMRSPYAKLEMMRKNSTQDEIQFTLYAVKDMETLSKIIGDEEYFRLTCFMNIEFMKNWNIARQQAQRLVN